VTAGEPLEGAFAVMSLRSKIILILTAVVALYALTDHVLQRRVLVPSFDALEREQALQAAERASLAIQEEELSLERRCQSWAHSPELRALLWAPSAHGASNYPGSDALASEGLQLFYLCQLDGTVLSASIQDPNNAGPLELREFPDQALGPQQSLVGLWIARENHQRIDDDRARTAARQLGPRDGRQRRSLACRSPDPRALLVERGAEGVVAALLGHGRRLAAGQRRAAAARTRAGR